MAKNDIKKYSLTLAIIVALVGISAIIGATVSGAAWYSWGTGRKYVPDENTNTLTNCFKTCCATKSVTVSEAFTLGVHSMKVNSISSGAIELEADGSATTLKLGDSEILGDTKITVNKILTNGAELNVCNA